MSGYVTLPNDDRLYNNPPPESVDGFSIDEKNPRLFHMLAPDCKYYVETMCKVCPRRTIKKRFCTLKDRGVELKCTTCLQKKPK